MTDHIRQAEDAAAAKVEALLTLPMPESSDMLGIEGEFDPWAMFPAIYGSYSSSFDKCAVEVLEELRDGERRRDDLGADMIREMLCVSDLCSYGTSPRVCFPNSKFQNLLPALIEKWRAWATLAWADGWDQE
jgi:hypothetical protein